MAGGINFRIGGVLDPSYKGALAQSVTEAKSAAQKITAAQENQYAGYFTRLTTTSAKVRRTLEADAAVSQAAKDLIRAMGSDWDRTRAGIQPERDALAQALRARRALRDVKSFAAEAGSDAGGGFLSNFIAKFAGQSGKMGMMQLVHTFRATFDAIVAGINPWRVLLYEAPQAMQAITLMGGGMLKVLAAVAVGATAVAAIIAAPFIWLHRVNSLVKDMVGPMRDAWTTEHIAKYQQKAETISELQKDITDEVRRTRDAHASVAEVMNRELELTRDRINFERELLELQKANELAKAKTPAEREAIEKRYSASLIANKKQERDAELQNMRDIAARLPQEIANTKAAIESAIYTPGYISKEHDARILKDRMKADETWEIYRAQAIPGAKDRREFSLEADRKRLQKLNDLAEQQVLTGTSGYGAVKTYSRRGLTEKEQLELDNIKSRMETAQKSKESLEAWQDSTGDRERMRARVDELRKKVVDDEKYLAALGDNKNGLIADTARKNLQRDKEDLRLEQERLKRTDNPGNSRSGQSMQQIQWERAGGFLGGPQVSLLDEARTTNRKLEAIHHAIKTRPVASSKTPYDS